MILMLWFWRSLFFHFSSTLRLCVFARDLNLKYQVQFQEEIVSDLHNLN
jgi:hypothetical protein